MKKRLAYISGSRAEYGIVKRLLHALDSDPELDFVLIATAMHLDPRYGETVRQMEADGFRVHRRVPVDLDSGSNETVIRSMADTLAKFGSLFAEEHFDAVMILGDRYEMLAVGIAAAMHNIPMIHLHGGEQTLGNYDEFIRHALSKMSRLHLAATETYRRRLIQLGEPPESVVNTGSLGAENSLVLPLPDKHELAQAVGSLDKPYFMVVFHPETLNPQPVSAQLDEVLAALSQFACRFDFIFIGANSDTGSEQIFQRFQDYTAQHGYRFFTSLPPEHYLALIKYSCGMIGNTSSGLLEVPSLGVATVNIGDRQKGRVRGESVIDTAVERQAICAGIERLLSSEFQAALPEMVNPYYQNGAMAKAYAAVKAFVQQDHSRPKAFYDLPHSEADA